MSEHNPQIFLAEMEALQDSRYFTIRKKIWDLKDALQSTLHWHDYYEIEFITGGEGTHVFNGETYPLHRGCAYLLTPKDFHTVTENPEKPLQLYNINFSDQLLSPALSQQLNCISGIFRITFDEEDTHRLEGLMGELLQEYETEKKHRGEMMRSLFEQTLIRMIRQKLCEEEQQEIHQGTETGGKPSLPVNEVINHLKLHFREQVSLSGCARMVFLTPNYLGELFHRATNMSFNEYLKHLRFDYALNLLNLSNISVEQISRLSGFHSVSYFIALFRKQFGITPSQYRKLDEAQRNSLMRERLPRRRQI